MGSSKLISPLSTIYYVIFTLFCLTAASSSSSSIFDLISYDDHCGSVVLKASPTDTESTMFPFSDNQRGYFLGGDELATDSSDNSYSSSGRKFYLRTDYVYGTSDADVLKVVAGFFLDSQGTQTRYVGGTSYTETLFGPSEFKLEGFWSQSTGKLCMVGSTSDSSSKVSEGYAVIKVSGVKDSCDVTGLVTGTLERSSNLSAPFKPVRLLMFPQKKCEDAKLLQAATSGLPAEIDISKELSLSLPRTNPICKIFESEYSPPLFELEYESSCKSPSCNPFGESLGYLPEVMSLSITQCSEDKRSPSFLAEFPNSSYADAYRPLNTSSSLVAHGAWDATKRQLFAVACRILSSAGSTDGSQVDDCSIRLSLRLPATWSSGNRSSIVGYLWSNKKKQESGYFDRIKFRSSATKAFETQGLKYTYTWVERATRSCQNKKQQAKGGKQFPEGSEYDMKFSMSIKDFKGKGSLWGYSTPVFVGDQPYTQDFGVVRMVGDARSQGGAKIPNDPVSISYDMTFTSYNESSGTSTVGMRIYAEGTYNPGTGFLCMIGCRRPDAQITATEAMDCEILVNVQFPPIHSNRHIEGKIESTREKYDPLHFESISFSVLPYYSQRDTIWRMDFEIIMAVVSNALVCIFVACQILYVKKRRNVFGRVSIVMLVVFTLGQMIPLLLNFDALFSSSRNHGGFIGSSSGGWVEINEVFVRAITMVSFLLHVRLLQLVFSKRMADGNQKASWIAEKKTLCVCLPLYIAGGLIAFLVHQKKYGFGEVLRSRRRFYGNQRSIWDDSTSYAGLVLDGFLLPQVLFNIFRNSSEHALSCVFYLGTTFIRLVPHAYDLYRARHFVDSGSYMYGDPGADYFSTPWDVTILLLGLLLASLIFLQQCFGGRCILPKRFKQTVEYEKLPVEASDP